MTTRNEDNFHVFVTDGKFMRSVYFPKGEIWLHDGSETIVTFEFECDANAAQVQYGGEIITTLIGSYRIKQEG